MEKRGYRMLARAEATAQTRVRIMEAFVELFMVRDFDAITLETIAARAKVTLQTVLRHFKTKDGLLDAATLHWSSQLMATREPLPSPRRPARSARVTAVRTLVASYEQMGDANWRLLRYEGQHPPLRRILDNARRLHRGWLERTFVDLLTVRGVERGQRLDALFTATDFYTWKLHREDLGRSRQQTVATMLRLIDALARQWEEHS